MAISKGKYPAKKRKALVAEVTQEDVIDEALRNLWKTVQFEHYPRGVVYVSATFGTSSARLC